TDPGAAKAWRHAVRDVLGGLMKDGARVTGFAREGGYVVERRTEDEPRLARGLNESGDKRERT
ncbi:hypothetical protein ACFSIL_34680, partial [Streptosporangium lutulentum]